MKKLAELLTKIYYYYPQGLSYDSEEYKNSSEFQRLQQKRQEAWLHLDYQKHIFAKLQKLFQGYHVKDWTDFEELNDYEYIILLHKNQPILDGDTELLAALGGVRREIYFFVSILEKYYCYFVVQSNYDAETEEWTFQNIYEEIPEINENLENVSKFFKQEGYEELGLDIILQKVPGVQTELTEMNEATVFDCLFNDLITP